MKKNLIIIVMAIVIIALCAIVITTRNQNDMLNEQAFDSAVENVTILAENYKIRCWYSDVFDENMDYRTRLDEMEYAIDDLTTECKEAKKSAAEWEACYARAYRVAYDATKIENDASNDIHSEYEKELAFNSQKNVYFGN